MAQTVQCVEYLSRESDEAFGAGSETQPLLGDTENQSRVHKSSPLPKRGLAVLCALRVVEPIAFTQIFPYVNEMIHDLRLTEDINRIGFYSGLVESTFAIAQLFSIYQWARLSDIIGRRPVIIMGLLGVAVTTVFFGLSRSLQGILIARFLAGLAAGNIAVVHSVLGEITDSTNQGIAFPIYGLVWPIGAIIGTTIGGTFSHPAQRFPSICNYWLFRAYPYLLPGFMAGSIAFLGALTAFFLLEETLPRKRQQSSTTRESIDSSGSQPYASQEKPPSMRKLLEIPVIRSLTLSGSALAFLQTGYDVVFALFAYTPVRNGGLGFTSAQIGYCLSAGGMLSIGTQLLLLPFLLRRARPARIYSACMSMWLLVFALIPCMNVVARAGLDLDGKRAEGEWALALWGCVAFTIFWNRIACLSYSVNMILIRDHAPSAEALGTTNGIAQLSMSLARAIAPAAVSSAFALAIDVDLFGGQIWVSMMIAVSLLGICATRSIARSAAGAVEGKGCSVRI